MDSIPLNNLDQSEVGNLKVFIFGIISCRYYQFWMLSTVATSADAVVNHHWQRLVVILFILHSILLYLQLAGNQQQFLIFYNLHSMFSLPLMFQYQVLGVLEKIRFYKTLLTTIIKYSHVVIALWDSLGLNLTGTTHNLL